LTATFEQFPSTHTATELYELASILGCAGDLPEAAFSLSEKHRDQRAIASDLSAPELPQLAECAVKEFEQTARREIRRFRALLAKNPGRPFCWSELARHFLVVGEQEKAIRSMQGALQLAKNNRYLLRAATRLFVHVGDPERAIHTLRSAPGIKSDPWLLAADIATSSVVRTQSRFFDAGRQVLSANQFSPHQLSELAAAIGTVEIAHGATKRARLQFAKSLIAPTENALAQAQWATEQDVKIVIPATAWDIPDSFEANALRFRQQRDWKGALNECAAWLGEEPFSLRPALMGSYLGFRPEYHATAEQFATIGLNSDGGNICLLNNRAVARAYQGNVYEAHKDVKHAMQDDIAKRDPHLLATLGLIAFRSGMPLVGREFYGRCIAWFAFTKDPASIASAVLHLLREEIRADPSMIPQAIQLSAQIAKSPVAIKRPELIGFAEYIGELSVQTGAASREDVATGAAQASAEELRQQASLFDVPAAAERRWSHRLEEYGNLLQ
jgi:tetratricopeptide (TPR) repeat protein